MTGPSEMGKTAIARIVARAKLTEGWEAHECWQPRELWRLFAEKASILFRHARSRPLTARGVELVRTHGWGIVDHPHFTPERIRRFVAHRLPRWSPSTLRSPARTSARQ